jgi:hypothetical protein
MTHRVLRAAVLVLVLVTPGVSLAQSKMDQAITATSTEPAPEDLESPRASAADKATITAMPATPSDVVLADSATKQSYLNAMTRYYEYRANGYAYRSRVFEWQLLSSRLIFAVVLALVCAGLYFAWVQFRAAMLAASRPATAPDSAGQGVTLATQLEMSAKGIVVNSSVMGVIILALSLGFFYLYLVYVYPITDTF